MAVSSLLKLQLREVVIGRWRGARVAVKILLHEGADHKGNVVVAREAVIGAALSHPNIVRKHSGGSCYLSGYSTEVNI